MAARSEAKVTEFPKRDPFDFPANTDKVSYMGVDYTFRELTVKEIDDARDMSTDGTNFDGRLMTRLMVANGSVEPKMDLDQLSNLPQRLYNAIVDCVNDLNNPDALGEENKPGNS